MSFRDRKRKDINKIVSSFREAETLRELPTVLIPIWQIKLRQRFGINVDREIASYVVLATHEQGTWKRQRAIRKIEKLLEERGMSREESVRKAREIVEMAVSNSDVSP
ncbi:MAG: hypothetical protein M1402_02510 [Candidatus Thermoplasmatota archaeon]|nr:hypothetical protein [Candidatus Thermoplasmatota archaeon]